MLRYSSSVFSCMIARNIRKKDPTSEMTVLIYSKEGGFPSTGNDFTIILEVVRSHSEYNFLLKVTMPSTNMTLKFVK